ncbi:uncharacterized protein PHACADRAFT_186479 [Phanerochaete carnosa HHB-10118-sp]|uniref:DUF6534 domain-containing protein n=1 Tax=Phanerochaete carnosa (strain HHB-10118-sp) TaxID=650164 RepID=K5VLN5_PHACS|nr:uncharacterized protein PHACADRAFT_186479 [Phanerochaete carnosa HHB-10118-sp]EKM52303.1 hypothetical protein PHACADRAFT_186479 [Phanerochaete carnosa HHB-10118-sp]
MAINFEIFMGPLLILVCIALILFGVFCAQVYSYWTTYEHDPLNIKLLVLALSVLEFTHSALCLHILFEYFISDIGNPAALGGIVWCVQVTVFIEIFIVTLSQGFSIVRIWQLSERNVYATATAVVLLFFRVAFGFGTFFLSWEGVRQPDIHAAPNLDTTATGTLLYVYRTWDEFHSHLGSFATFNCGLALAAVVDLVTTVLLTYYLRRNRPAFRRSRFVIQKLIFYTVNTGALTMLFSVTTLFLFRFLGTSLMFGGMVEIISKLYANSTLALLNARQRIKNQAAADTSGINSIPLELRGGSSSGTSQIQITHPTRVKVDIFREVSTSAGDPGMSTPRENGLDTKGAYEMA